MRELPFEEWTLRHAPPTVPFDMQGRPTIGGGLYIYSARPSGREIAA